MFSQVHAACVSRPIFPQQRQLLGSSAQNSSGVHCCRHRVRFNGVPEKVPKVLEKVWEVLVQSQVTFNRVPEKVPEKVLEKVWEALVQSQVRSREGSRRPWCKANSASTGFRRRFRRTGKSSGEGLGGFGAELNRVPEKNSGEGLGGFG